MTTEIYFAWISMLMRTQTSEPRLSLDWQEPLIVSSDKIRIPVMGMYGVRQFKCEVTTSPTEMVHSDWKAAVVTAIETCCVDNDKLEPAVNVRWPMWARWRVIAGPFNTGNHAAELVAHIEKITEYERLVHILMDDGSRVKVSKDPSIQLSWEVHDPRQVAQRFGDVAGKSWIENGRIVVQMIDLSKILIELH